MEKIRRTSTKRRCLKSMIEHFEEDRENVDRDFMRSQYDWYIETLEKELSRLEKDRTRGDKS